MKLTKLVVALSVLSALYGCKRAPTPTAAQVDPITAGQARVANAPSFENYISLGLAYINAGRHEEALKAFQQTAVISPRSPIAFNNICAEYNALKHWDLAVENCQKALQIEPSFQLAKNNLIAAQKSKTVQAEKLASLKQMINAGKEVEKNRLDLGMEYYSSGEYEAAVEVWQQIPKGSSLFAIVQNDLASAYILMKKFDLAKIHLDRALDLQPRNQLFLNNRQWLQSASQAK